MKTVVVYESMYGNSHRVADCIGTALAEVGSAIVVPVAAATSDLIAGADLVIVGGPTHMHSMSTSRTRASAPEEARKSAAKHGTAVLDLDPNWRGPGVRDWLRALPGSQGKCAAAFDTRLTGRALLTGRASRAIARGLERHGFQLIAEPESFLVDSDTRLLDSEAERAGHWARGLAASMR